jgi:hypothetical protein
MSFIFPSSIICRSHLNVEKNNGGITLTLPKTLANQYKDMYVEMDVEFFSTFK